MDEGASAKLLRCLARHGIELRSPDLPPYLTAWRAFQAGLRTSATGN
jgi:hypothetical protein